MYYYLIFIGYNVQFIFGDWVSNDDFPKLVISGSLNLASLNQLYH